MGTWFTVGRVGEWASGRGRRVTAGELVIAVFRTKRGWIALDDRCPHMGASLADGFVAGSEVQCSWHEWRYDVETGQCPIRPWARVRVYPVRIDGDDVRIEVPDPSRPPAPRAGDDEPEWLSWDPNRYFKKRGDA